MDILVALQPKNMTIKEVASASTGELLTTYVFNRAEYTHVGSWPPIHTPGFHVPIASVRVADTGVDITRKVKRFAGPGHTVTRETLRYAMGTWYLIPTIQIKNFGVSIRTRAYMKVPDITPTVVITDVLGQTSMSFCAK